MVGILFAVSILITNAIAAEDAEQDVALGIGGEDCSVFMNTYEHNPNSVEDDHDVGDEGPHHEATYTSLIYITWLQGYLSAYNLHENNGDDVSVRASIGGMLYFLYRRCSDSPDAAFHTVMPALIERLKSR
ncbi:MAG: hypothetical protein ACI9XC_000958 [Gammaproteobacteria bacterium]|jgi:hypothetical protein